MKYTLVVISLMLFSTFAAAQDRVKIGFIDVQRAISESQSGKRARDKFQDKIKKAETDLLKEKKELERLKSECDKKTPLLKDEERRNL
ncbi:MAG: OmpH family outer membrane protein, partial [Candidatus Binatia bacterium]|nr:OmpH family outer membrane protein [Candidatus Binatia bacterium]